MEVNNLAYFNELLENEDLIITISTPHGEEEIHPEDLDRYLNKYAEEGILGLYDLLGVE